jgi:hypothetical protein
MAMISFIDINCNRCYNVGMKKINLNNLSNIEFIHIRGDSRYYHDGKKSSNTPNSVSEKMLLELAGAKYLVIQLQGMDKIKNQQMGNIISLVKKNKIKLHSKMWACWNQPTYHEPVKGWTSMVTSGEDRTAIYVGTINTKDHVDLLDLSDEDIVFLSMSGKHLNEESIFEIEDQSK